MISFDFNLGGIYSTSNRDISFQVKLMKYTGNIYKLSCFRSSLRGASSGITSVYCGKSSTFTREPGMRDTFEVEIRPSQLPAS